MSSTVYFVLSRTTEKSPATTPGTVFEEDQTAYNSSLNAKYHCKRVLTADKATLLNGDAALRTRMQQRDREHLLEDSAATQDGFVINGSIDPDILLQLFQSQRYGSPRAGSSRDASET